MFFKKIIFQNRYVALETGLDPPPFMANAILNFHFKFAFWCVSDVFKEQRVVCALKSECGVCWGKLSDAAARLFHPSCILQFTALHLLVQHHVHAAE